MVGVHWPVLDPWKRVLRIQAVAKGDPDATTGRVIEAFGAAMVSIVDAHFFAGVVTVLAFESEPQDLARLADALVDAGLRIDDANRAALVRAAAATGSVRGTLAITFAHGDPNRRHEVPSVPG